MKRTIVSLVIGTLILFIWSAISWMVLPFHSNTLNAIPDNTLNTEILKENLVKDGVYHYPGFPAENTPQTMKEMEEKVEKGPRITLMVFKRGKTELFSATSFLGSLAINFFTVFLLYLIIRQSKVQTSKSIISISLLAALIIGFASDLSQMNWYMFPLDYTLINMIDHIIPFLLIGLLFSKTRFKEITL
jgi:hypothetical protein